MSPFLPKQLVISAPLPRLDGDSISTQHLLSMIITPFLSLGGISCSRKQLLKNLKMKTFIGGVLQMVCESSKGL